MRVRTVEERTGVEEGEEDGHCCGVDLRVEGWMHGRTM